MRTETKSKDMNWNESVWHSIEGVGAWMAALIPAFAGSLISVIYEANVTRRRAFILVLAGTCTAGYVTPLVGHLFSLGDGLTNALSFLLGLLGMRLIGFIITVLEVVREDKELMKGLIQFFKRK